MAMEPGGPIEWDFEAALKRLRYGAVTILQFVNSTRVFPGGLVAADPSRTAGYARTHSTQTWLALLLYAGPFVDPSRDQFEFLWR